MTTLANDDAATILAGLARSSTFPPNFRKALRMAEAALRAQGEPVADVLENGNTFRLRKFMPPGTKLYAAPLLQPT